MQHPPTLAHLSSSSFLRRISLLQAGMLARRASSSFSCNRQPCYRHCREPTLTAGSIGPQHHPGARHRILLAATLLGTVLVGFTRPWLADAPLAARLPPAPGGGRSAWRGQPLQHTTALLDTRGPTLPRHRKHHTRGERSPIAAPPTQHTATASRTHCNLGPGPRRTTASPLRS